MTTAKPDLLLFGYGSLISPDSAAKAITRPLAAGDLKPARLRGFERAWTCWDWVAFHDQPDDPVPLAFLNVVESPGASCNGVLIPVTEDELAAMDRRERNYDRVEVTGNIEAVPPGRVFTYRGKPEYETLPADCVLAENYLQILERGLQQWPAEFAAEFRRATRPENIPRRGGGYRFLDAEQNRLTGR